ncbi:hypothetical protein ACHAW5_007012 [Stephanodiscus triporus]|uniref:Uncharacterized protein n=1 Tax=Stephanodiscus triporus TaxID=2934178 RepID=A0ABD3P3Z1_9STRA
MALSDDEVLAHLGIKSAEPFNWGDESQMVIAGNDASDLSRNLSAPLSGLDSIKAYVQDKNNGTDVSEKRILRALFGDVDLSTPKMTFEISTQSAIEDRHQALMEDTLRDVSIKGLSDRAVAELNVESRTSLFGSILRLFDMPRDGGNPMKDASSGGDGIESTIAMAVTAVDATSAGEAVVDPMIMKEPILSTAEIVRSVHLTARPGDIPAGMDSKEYTLSVLHFLSSYIPYLHEDEKEYRDTSGSQEGWDQLRRTLPVLPLIKATNPAEGLELRCYGRVRPLVKLGQKERRQYPESMDRDESFRNKVLNLERIYSSSLPFSSPIASAKLSSKLSSVSTDTSSKLPVAAAITQKKEITPEQKSGNDLPFAFQKYVARRKVVPHIEGGYKEELTLMISGHMQQPQHTPGPKRSKSGANEAPPTVESASFGASSTDTKSIPSDKEKGAVNPNLKPLKRKADAVTDDVFHVSKKGREFDN